MIATGSGVGGRLSSGRGGGGGKRLPSNASINFVTLTVANSGAAAGWGGGGGSNAIGLRTVSCSVATTAGGGGGASGFGRVERRRVRTHTRMHAIMSTPETTPTAACQEAGDADALSGMNGALLDDVLPVRVAVAETRGEQLTEGDPEQLQLPLELTLGV